MRKAYLLNIILAVGLVVLSVKLAVGNNRSTQAQDEEQEAVVAADSTTAGQWQKVSLEEADINPFTLFSHSAVLSVGKPEAMNAMAIGWGQLGSIWGGGRAVCTVYVRHSRFTKHLMDENETFTVEAFPEQYNEVVNAYLGRVSGRDEDKMKGCGLTLKTMENGAPAFEEGKIILECRKLSTTDIKAEDMAEDIVSRWYAADDANNIHTQYIGEITAVWVKK